MKKLISGLLLFSMILTMALTPAMTSSAEGEPEEPILHVGIQGNGGTFYAKLGEEDNIWEERYFDNLGNSVEEDKNVGQALHIYEMSEPEYWTKRTFLGWKLFKWTTIVTEDDKFSDWTVYDERTFTSNEDMLAYTFAEGTTGEFAFIAQWEGDEEDFYTQIEFDAFGGTLYGENFRMDTIDGEEKEVKEPYVSEGWNMTIKRNGSKISEQIQNFRFTYVPAKGNATFQGWMVFQVEEGENGQTRTKLSEDGVYLTTDEALEMTVPNYSIMFIAKWNDIPEEDYVFNGGDEEEPEFDPDRMIVNYTYYDTNGECMWMPKDMSLLKEDGSRMTYDEVFAIAKGEMSPKDHYEKITFNEWNFTGSSFGEDFQGTDEAWGGEIYLTADYDKFVVMVNTVYYDEEKNVAYSYEPVIIDKGSTYDDLYKAALKQLELDKKVHGYEFVEWTSDIEDMNAEITEMQTSVQISAIYKDCPVEFIYQYLKDGKVETKIVSKSVSGKEKLADLYLANIPSDIPTKSIYGWALNPLNVWGEYPSAATAQVQGAAQYMEETIDGETQWKSPVFASRQPIAYDEAAGEYYIPEQTEDIYYVSAATPANEDDGQAVEALEKDLLNVVDQAEGADVKDFAFRGYEIHYKEISEGFIKESNAPGDFAIYTGPRYWLKATYSKALVILEYPDGTVEQSAMEIPDPENAPAPTIKLPATYKGNELLWDKGVAFAGGNAILGGMEATIESPYTKFTTYNVAIRDLTEAPEEVNKNLEEIMKEMADESFEYKKWKDGDISYYDVELLLMRNEGEWKEVEDDKFPENGKVIYLPYPEGTDKETDFVISHMITSEFHEGKKVGDIEILDFKKCDQGIRIIAKSLSPVAIAFNGEELEEDIAPGGSISEGEAGDTEEVPSVSEDTEESIVKTGDTANVGMYVVTMMFALVTIIVCKRRFR